MNETAALHAFSAYGIELEYMIIRKSDGRVAPLVDRIMINQTGQPVSDCSVGRCEVSNELAAHVFELKVPEPTDNLEATEADFAEAVLPIARQPRNVGHQRVTRTRQQIE